MRKQIAFARSLRRQQTPAELAFWAVLYPWRSQGMHWRRQCPIGPYVVDFCCKGHKIIVEIDGDSHFTDEGLARDAKRSEYLHERGMRVVRFTNVDVLETAEAVFDLMCQEVGRPGEALTRPRLR